MRLSNYYWRLLGLQSALVAAVTAVVIALASTGQPPWTQWTAAGAGVVASAVAMWFSLRQIFMPLEELSREARQVAGSNGDLDDADDLGVLATILNRMQRDLSQRVGQAQENSQRLQTVLESMIEGVLAVGTDQQILLANDAGRAMLDFTTPQPVGKPLLAVTRARPVYEAVLEAFAQSAPVEKEFQSPGSSRKTLSLRATRLPGDPCPGVMVVLHDVTELRRLENLRRELVANVSHELKTPLAAIKAYAETLRMGAVNDPTHNLAFVQRIEEQTERLHQLILDILQIARVESGQETFEIGDVRLLDVFEDCAAQFAGAAAARQIVLHMELPPGELTARCDEEGIRTILTNLVDNAIKYTPPQGRVTVRAIADEPTVTIEVQDTGIGIAEKEQARIFERFYRVDKARSRELGGTGLGLSIVKHLAQSFGGTVGVASALKKGSTFRVTLPRRS
ncbi:MAG TPA: ATP-binding protein [Pirellulaceae bacterium]|nr:ATP-binding protein [Pirellulaceae bacterium]